MSGIVNRRSEFLYSVVHSPHSLHFLASRSQWSIPARSKGPVFHIYSIVGIDAVWLNRSLAFAKQAMHRTRCGVINRLYFLQENLMKKSISTILLATCSMGMALTATAAPAAEQSGFYLGTGIGYSVNQLEGDNIYSKNGTEKRTDTGFKLYGGYQFNNNWAIEAQYVKIGAYSADTKKLVDNRHGTVKASGVSVAAVGMLPLGESFSLLGKAGVMLKTVDGSEYNDAKTFRNNFKSTKTTALLGVGAEFKVTPQLALRVEYEYLGSTALGANNEGPKLRNDLISIGARYTF